MGAEDGWTLFRDFAMSLIHSRDTPVSEAAIIKGEGTGRTGGTDRWRDVPATGASSGGAVGALLNFRLRCIEYSSRKFVGVRTDVSIHGQEAQP